MKIRLTFTEEHIALIKALDFKKIDFMEIMNTFPGVDREESVVDRWDETTGKPLAINSLRVGDLMERYHISIDSVYGIDTFNPWGGTYLWEQISYIIGIRDHAVGGTDEDPDGPKFTDEDMEHMRDLDTYIIGNLPYIEQILHQFCTEGIQPGVTYWAYDHQLIWHRADEDDVKGSKAR